MSLEAAYCVLLKVRPPLIGAYWSLCISLLTTNGPPMPSSWPTSAAQRVARRQQGPRSAAAGLGQNFSKFGDRKNLVFTL